MEALTFLRTPAVCQRSAPFPRLYMLNFSLFSTGTENAQLSRKHRAMSLPAYDWPPLLRTTDVTGPALVSIGSRHGVSLSRLGLVTNRHPGLVLVTTATPPTKVLRLLHD